MSRRSSSRGVVGAVFALFAIACALFATPRWARAASVQLESSLSADTVELGDTLTYSLRAMVTNGAMPSDPSPGPVPGFTVVDSSASPMRMQMNFNGQPSSMNSLTATWRIRADKLGTFTLGPASASIEGARQSARSVRVTVVAKGSAPRRRGSPDPFDPFGGMDPFGGKDPFGGLSPFGGPDPFSGALSPFRGLFDDDDAPSMLATADPKLNLDRPLGPVAFLHATIDKSKAVVGEQVTLDVYLYTDPRARQGQPSDVHEATANDFVRRTLLEDETRTTPLGTAMVGGRLWNVSLVRKSALFPLKTGHLPIGPMSLTLPHVSPGLRASEPLAVDVTDAPLDGRPAGFVSGNVGNFSLQATVSDRAVEQHGAVGVTLELRGTGNLPADLPIPVTRGIEWLDATTRERLAAQQGGKFGGTRTFSYVVRLHDAGAVDLGEIRLPFYDPDRRTYDVARATLGIVNVTPGSDRDGGVDDAASVLPNLPEARTSLERPRRERALSDAPLYWLALFGAPLACALFLGGERAWASVRKRRDERQPSPARVAKTRRAEARAAVAGGDPNAALGAIVRAVGAVVLAETGVHLGATIGAAARDELREAGVSEATSTSLVDVLKSAEDARFSPEGVTAEAARDIWDRAEAALAALEEER